MVQTDGQCQTHNQTNLDPAPFVAHNYAVLHYILHITCNCVGLVESQ